MAVDDITIVYADETMRTQAEQLAKSLKLSIDDGNPNQLQITEQGLWLKLKSFKPLQADFSWSTWRMRREQGKSQDLIKACKIKPGMTVIDTTAGWGRDAALMASFGARVIMLERNPFMQVLLEDGLRRQTSKDRQLLSLQLVNCEAHEYLDQIVRPIDVIYIDPMHPLRQKTALVKKDLQVLQTVIGPDKDAKQLLETALKAPGKRVIVKWPIRQPALLPPTLSWTGKTVRYDCYLNA